MQTETVSVRTYQPEDKPKLEHLIEIMNATDPTLQVEGFMLVAGFPNHDPLTDSVVLEVANQIIGYGWIGGIRSDRNDCWIGVTPEHRRKGYGTLLLERLLERASQRNASGLMAYLPGREPALEFANQSGFEVQGYFRELHLSAETPRRSIILPNGWKLEPYSESLDVERYATILDASYADLWGHGIASPDVMQSMLSTLEPQDTFLVVDANGLDVGCAGLTKGNPQWIDAPGLIPTHRSAQNYQAVLATVLNKLEPGFEVILNSWGDSDETIAAYTELGFVEHKRTAMAWRAVELWVSRV
jgi:GNAT superfamily N-acetyltransferase